MNTRLKVVPLKPLEYRPLFSIHPRHFETTILLNHGNPSTIIHIDDFIPKDGLRESIKIAQDESLEFLSAQREHFEKLSHKEAIRRLIESYNIDNRAKMIAGVADNGLMKIS